METVIAESTKIVNQFTQILVDLGCDVTVMPKNQLELGVLWIKYSWAVFLLGLGVKALMKAFSIFARGSRL